MIFLLINKSLKDRLNLAVGCPVFNPLSNDFDLKVSNTIQIDIIENDLNKTLVEFILKTPYLKSLNLDSITIGMVGSDFKNIVSGDIEKALNQHFSTSVRVGSVDLFTLYSGEKAFLNHFIDSLSTLNSEEHELKNTVTFRLNYSIKL